jgi:hypothetical protein
MPVEIVFETTRSHTPTRFFFSRVLQPFGVNLLGNTVYQDMRRMEELFRNSNHHNTIAKPNGGDSCSRVPARTPSARQPTPSRERRVLLGESCSPLTSTILYLLADHLLVDLGRAAATTLPSVETRAAAWTSGAGEAGKHRDLSTVQASGFATSARGRLGRGLVA